MEASLDLQVVGFACRLQQHLHQPVAAMQLCKKHCSELRSEPIGKEAKLAKHSPAHHCCCRRCCCPSEWPATCSYSFIEKVRTAIDFRGCYTSRAASSALASTLCGKSVVVPKSLYVMTRCAHWQHIPSDVIPRSGQLLSYPKLWSEELSQCSLCLSSNGASEGSRFQSFKLFNRVFESVWVARFQGFYV